MLDPQEFLKILNKNTVNFFVGVPDSLLKNFCSFIDLNVENKNHIIAANEGNAIAIGAGHYIASKKIPLVYMQNSGFGNAINPLLSLCDKDVYSIPMLLLIGWRGEPGLNDEPQHVKQGSVQQNLFDSIGLTHYMLSTDIKETDRIITDSVKSAIKNERPVALVVRKNTFLQKNYSLVERSLDRENVLEKIINILNPNDIIVSTTGKTSREIFEIRRNCNHGHNRDFLTVGSMGHCSSIALGLANANKNIRVICIDGDGSFLMHLGAGVVISQIRPRNLIHIVLNNGCHESVGGQPTAASKIDLFKISKAMNYDDVFIIKTINDLEKTLPKIFNIKGTIFIEIKLKPGSRANLGRPSKSPIQNKIALMDYISKIDKEINE